MRKVLFALLLVVAVWGLSFSSPVGAQAKKDAATIEIAEGKDGKFRFFVRDDEDKLLAMSSPGGFETEKAAKEAIDHLKAVIGKAKVTVKKETKDKDKGPEKDKK
jgi:hypothetical protein